MPARLMKIEPTCEDVNPSNMQVEGAKSSGRWQG